MASASSLAFTGTWRSFLPGPGEQTLVVTLWRCRCSGMPSIHLGESCGQARPARYNKVAGRGGVARNQAAKNAPPAPAEAASTAPAVEPAADPMEQLAKLGALKEQGVLTEEEFAAQKAKILAQM